MEEDLTFETEFFESVLEKLPHDIRTVELLGNLYTKQGRIKEGLVMDEKAVSLTPESPTARYNLACSYSLTSREAEALEELKKAVDLGYNDLDWMLEDKDLTALHSHPEFKNLIQALSY